MSEVEAPTPGATASESQNRPAMPRSARASPSILYLRVTLKRAFQLGVAKTSRVWLVVGLLTRRIPLYSHMPFTSLADRKAYANPMHSREQGEFANSNGQKHELSCTEFPHVHRGHVVYFVGQASYPRPSTHSVSSASCPAVIEVIFAMHLRSSELQQD